MYDCDWDCLTVLVGVAGPPTTERGDGSCLVTEAQTITSHSLYRTLNLLLEPQLSSPINSETGISAISLHKSRSASHAVMM